jgi:hypothetical protein
MKSHAGPDHIAGYAVGSYPCGSGVDLCQELRRVLRRQADTPGTGDAHIQLQPGERHVVARVKAQTAKGKAKKDTGRVTGEAKQATDKIKDAFKH